MASTIKLPSSLKGNPFCQLILQQLEDLQTHPAFQNFSSEDLAAMLQTNKLLQKIVELEGSRHAELTELKAEQSELKAELKKLKAEAAEERASRVAGDNALKQQLEQIEARDTLARLSEQFTLEKDNVNRVIIYDRGWGKQSENPNFALGNRLAHGQNLSIPRRHEIIREALTSTPTGQKKLKEFRRKSPHLTDELAIDQYLEYHTACSPQDYEKYKRGQCILCQLSYIVCANPNNLENHEHAVEVAEAYAWVKESLRVGDRCLITSFQEIYENSEGRSRKEEFASLPEKFPKLKPWLKAESSFHKVYKGCRESLLLEGANEEKKNQFIGLMFYIFDSKHLGMYPVR